MSVPLIIVAAIILLPVLMLVALVVITLVRDRRFKDDWEARCRAAAGVTGEEGE